MNILIHNIYDIEVFQCFTIYYENISVLYGKCFVVLYREQFNIFFGKCVSLFGKYLNLNSKKYKYF